MATRTGTIARIVATQKIACASSILTASMTDGSKECDDNPENEVRRHTVTPLRVLAPACGRSEEHTSELQSRGHLVCGLLLEKKNATNSRPASRRDPCM